MCESDVVPHPGLKNDTDLDDGQAPCLSVNGKSRMFLTITISDHCLLQSDRDRCGWARVALHYLHPWLHVLKGVKNTVCSLLDSQSSCNGRFLNCGSSELQSSVDWIDGS